MLTKQLAEEVRAEVVGLKDLHERFLQTYKRLCVYCGGPQWRKDHNEVVSHHVRKEIIPIMEQVGMDHKSVQALCSWAEKLATEE